MSHLRLVEKPDDERPPMLEGHWYPPPPPKVPFRVQAVRFIDRCFLTALTAKHAWVRLKREESRKDTQIRK